MSDQKTLDPTVGVSGTMSDDVLKISVLTRFYSAKEGAVRDRAAEAFHRSFPDAYAFFPADTAYYCSNELLPGNEFRLVDK